MFDSVFPFSSVLEELIGEGVSAFSMSEFGLVINTSHIVLGHRCLTFLPVSIILINISASLN